MAPRDAAPPAPALARVSGPYSSLNQRFRIREPLVNYGVSGRRVLDERVSELALKVGLRAEALDSAPHKSSGGQRRRSRCRPR